MRIGGKVEEDGRRVGVRGRPSTLSVMYGRGWGVLQDNVIAQMWSNLAAAQGNETASRSRDISAERMTPADIEEAEHLASECLAWKYKKCGR